MPTPILGFVSFVASRYVPRGYAACDGSLLEIQKHQRLFSILGTNYGGDGRHNFALPDLRGRLPVAYGNVPGSVVVRLGEQGGNVDVPLTPDHLPPHTHANPVLRLSSGVPNSTSGNDNLLAGVVKGMSYYSSRPDTEGSILAEDALWVQYAGQSDPLVVQSPVMPLIAVICTNGQYPNRS